ncbi:Ig-like domain-containing protein [Testudinibacter sp. P80/BLE/0925]
MSITLKVLSAKTEIANYKVVNGETLIIKAQENVNYQLIEDATGLGPQNIIAKRVGDDLQLLLENGDNVPDVIIEDYYSDEGSTNLIIGEHENGNIYAYVPESGQNSDAVSMLAEQMSAPQALGGHEISPFWVFSPWWLLAAGAVVGGVALAVGGGGSGSNSNEPAGDTTAPNAPTVTDVTNSDKDGDGKADSTTISGKAEPGSTVGIDTNGDGKADVTTKADENGDYSLVVTPALEDGKTYPVTATDPSGNTGNPTNVTGDTTAPNAPTVTDVTNSDKDGDGKADSTTISGKAEPGSTVGIDTNGDGKADVTTKADENGDYSLVVTPALEDGKTYPVTATDPSGNTGNPTNVTGDTTAPNAPTVTDVTNSDKDGDGKADSTTISGKAEPGSTVGIDTNGDGKAGVTTKADENGDYSLVVTPALEDGKTYPVTATDPSGNTSNPTNVTGDTTAPNAPTVTDVTNSDKDGGGKADSTTISGKAEPGSTVGIDTNGDGKADVTTKADENGDYSLVVTPALEDGKTYPVTATDPSGNTGNPTNVTGDTTAPNAPMVTDVTNSDKDGDGKADSTTISGKAEPGSTVGIDTNGDGKADVTTKADENGDYSLVVTPALEDGKTYPVTATDPSGNTSNPTNVTGDTTAPNAPTVTDVTNSDKDGDGKADSTTISGKAEPGSTVGIDTNGDGKADVTTKADENGDYSLVVTPALEDGKTYPVTATDPSGNTSDPTQVTGSGPDVTAPSAVAEADGSVTVTPPTDDDTKSVEVKFTAEDGTEKTVTVNKKDDGTWELAAPVEGVTLEAGTGKVTIAEDAVKDGSTVTAKANDGTQDSANATVVAKDVTAPSAPTATAEDNGDVSITPPADDDTKSVEVKFTAEDGTEKTVTVNKKDDGTWELAAPVEGVTLDTNTGKVTLAESAVKDNGKVTATAKDVDGNTSTPAEVTAKDTTAPAAPSAVAEENGSVTVTPPTDDDTQSVEVKFTAEDGTEKTVTVNKKDDGTWELAAPVEGVTLDTNTGKVTLDESAVKDNGKVTATAKDVDGNTSTPAEVTAKDTTAPAAPSAVAEENGDVSITPPADVDTKSVEVKFTDENGAEQTVTVNKKDDGTWELAAPVEGVTLEAGTGKVTIAEDAVKDGSTVTAKANDGTQDSANATVVAKDVTAPSAPTATAEDNGDVSITPPADVDTKSVEVKFTDENGAEQTVTVNKKDDGTWELAAPVEGVTLDTNTGKVTLAESAVKDGSTVTAKANDGTQDSAEATVVAKDVTAPSAPTATAEDNGDVSITPPADVDTKSVEVKFTAEDGTEKTVTVNKKDDGTWELAAPVEGVTLDTNTGKVTFAESAVKDGSTVTAKANDGTQDSANATVVAKDVTAPSAPTATAEENGDVSITPPADDDTKSVEVKFTAEDGTEKTVTVNKKDDGTWELAAPVEGVTLDTNTGKVTLAESAVKDNGKVTATAKDVDGNTSTPAEVTAKDTTAPAAPSAVAEENGSVTVTPPADDDTQSVEVTFTKPDGTEATVTATKKDDGTWELDNPVTGVTLDPNTGKVTLAESAVKDNGKVTATAKDVDGNTSTPAEVTAKDTTAPAAPSAVAEENGSVTVTPPTDVDTKSVEVKFTAEDGTEKTVTVNKKDDGTWELAAPVEGVTLEAGTGKVTIAEDAVKDGSTVTAKANDGTQDSANATVVAKDVTAPAAPSAVAEDNGDVSITPPTDVDTKSVEVKFTDENGAEQTVTVNKKDDGTWELAAPVEGVTLDPNTGKVTLAESAVKDNGKVTATAKDVDGNTSTPAEVTAKDTTAPAAPSAVAEENGSVTVTPPTDVDTKSVEVKFTAEDGTEKTVTVNKKDDGTWELAAPVEGVTLEAGTGKVTIAEDAVKDGSTVTAKANDGTQDSANATVVAKDVTAPSAPTATAEDNGDVSITPPADDDTKSVEVKFTAEDGTEKTVTVNKKDDGTWELAAPVEGVTLDTNTGKVTLAESAVKDNGKVTATAKDVDGNTSTPAEVTAKDTTAPAAPSAVAEENGSVTVTPPTDVDTKSVEVKFTAEDGTEKTVTVNKKDDGTWELAAPVEGVTLEAGTGKVTIAEDAVKDGSTVTAKANDGTQDSANATVVAKDVTAPAAPSAVAEDNGDVSITPPTDVDTKSVEVKFTDENGAEQTVTVNKKDDGTWELAAPVEGVTLEAGTGKVTLAESAVKDNGKVTATAKDVDGNTSTPAEVTAKDTTAPAAPSAVAEENGSVTVTPPTDVDTKSVEVKFTAEDGTEKTVTVNKKDDGTWELAAPVEGVTLEAGTGKVTIAEDAVKDGSTVTAKANDGTQDSANATVVAKDVTAPAAPSAVAEDNGDVSITPPTDVDTKSVEVKFTDENGAEQTVTVNKKDDGTWELAAPVEGVTLDPNTGKVTLAESAVKDNGKVTATAKDVDGNTSTPAEVTAKDTTAPAAPSAVAEENGSVTVTPPTDVDTKSVEVKFTAEDGTEKTVTVNKKDDGTWELAAPVEGVTLDTDSGKVTIAEDAVKDGSTVTAKANDGTQDSANATVVAKDVTAPSAPTATAEENGDVSITPPADVDTKSVEVKFTDENGAEQTVTVNKKDDGTWELAAPVEGVTLDTDSGKVTIAEDAVKDNGKVTATAKDVDGNTSTPAEVTAKDTNAPAAPSAVAEENGDVSITPPTDDDTQSVEVTFTKPDGTEATVTANKKDDGTWELATPVEGVTLDPNTGKVTLDESAVKDNGKVTATAKDVDGNTSTPAEVTAKDTNAPAAPSAVAEENGDVSITPPTDVDTKSVEVKFTDENGAEQTVTVNKKDDGTWELAAPVEGVTLDPNTGKVTIAEDAVKDGSTVTAKANDGTQDSANATVVAKDVTAPSAPTATAEDNGDVSITPPADVDTKSVEVKFTAEDGTEKTVTVNKKDDGTWELAAPVEGVTLEAGTGKVTIAEEAVKDSTEVKATASDADGNESNEVKVEAPTILLPAQPIVTLVSDTGFSSADKITNNGMINVSNLEEGTTREYSIDGGNTWIVIPGITGNTATFELAEGTYPSILVRQNKDGQSSVVGSLNDVFIDKTPPVIPELKLAQISDSGYSDTDNITNVKQPTLEGVTEPGTTVRIYVDGSYYADKANDTGKFSIKITKDMSDGQKFPLVMAVDAAGNASTATPADPTKWTEGKPFIVNLSAEQPIINQEGYGTVTVETNDQQAYKLTTFYFDTAGNKQTAVSTKGTDGNWNFTFSGPQPAGTFDSKTGKMTFAEGVIQSGSTVEVKLEDNAGNIADASRKLLFNPVFAERIASIEYFENSLISDVLGKVTATDKDNQVVQYRFLNDDGTETNISKDGRYLISSGGEFALTENGGGLTSTSANISTRDSNDFETAPNKFGPYKVIAIDQTGLKSKPIDVDFTVQNVLAIRTLWVDLNDRNGANWEGTIASADTANKNFQFTSENSDKILIGYNEAGKAETGLGIGNIERGAVLNTLDGDDYVKLSQSVGSNNMDGGIALGNGNNTLLIGNDIIGGTNRSWVTSGDGNDTIIVGDFSSIFNDRDDIQNATILTGAGNDTLRLQGGDVKSSSIIDMGSGNDSIIITDNGTALRADQSLDAKATYTGRDFGGHIYDSTIILGAGDDTLTTYNYLQDATIIGDTANTPIALDSSPYTPIGNPRDVKDSGISSLTGDDTVILGVNADGSRNGKGIMYYSSKIDLGGGNDTLIVDQIRDNSKVYMGDGNDSVTITKTFGRGDGSALVDMGAGNDTLTWSGNAGMGYNDLGSFNSKMLGGTGIDKLIVDSNVASGNDVISHISTVNFTGFEQIQLKNQAVLDIRYGDLFNDNTREGNFYVMGGSTNKVDLGQSNWNNDGVAKISLVDNGAVGNSYYNGSWVKQSSTTVEGITYDIYRHNSAASSSDNDVYIQQGIIVI